MLAAMRLTRFLNLFSLGGSCELVFTTIAVLRAKRLASLLVFNWSNCACMSAILARFAAIVFKTGFTDSELTFSGVICRASRTLSRVHALAVAWSVMSTSSCSRACCTSDEDLGRHPPIVFFGL